jgi:hypothetical protein
MWHLFMGGGRFQPEAIVAMRTAYEAFPQRASRHWP